MKKNPGMSPLKMPSFPTNIYQVKGLIPVIRECFQEGKESITPFPLHPMASWRINLAIRNK